MNKTTKMPFKKYITGEVFRDGPIKTGRYRQFTQFDPDIVGCKGMITDAEIANWKKFIDSIRDLTTRGHKPFIFHIGSSSGKRKSKVQRSLEDAGANVFPIKNMKDLTGLVIISILF